MATETVDFAAIQGALEALREEVSRLGKRIAALESSARPPAAQPAPAREELNEELILTITAAVAAYLGVQPRIRQIRLIGSGSWSQEGRATIQASHAITTARSQP